MGASYSKWNKDLAKRLTDAGITARVDPNKSDVENWDHLWILCLRYNLVKDGEKIYVKEILNK